MKILIIIILFFCAVNLSFAQNEEVFDWGDDLNTGTIYECKDADIPEVCFFPVEKARWNGETLNSEDWDKLTEVQKTIFIDEYVSLLEKRYNTAIQIKTAEYFVAINGFILFNDHPEPVLMTSVIDDLLNRDAAIVGSHYEEQ
ncbi:MAG: hypothetical protein ABII88_09080 [Candidatus Omnitrophota bacterium]